MSLDAREIARRIRAVADGFASDNKPGIVWTSESGIDAEVSAIIRPHIAAIVAGLRARADEIEGTEPPLQTGFVQ